MALGARDSRYRSHPVYRAIRENHTLRPDTRVFFARRINRYFYRRAYQ